MMTENLYRVIGLVVFALAAVALGWGLWPSKVSNHKITFPPDRLTFPGEQMSVDQEAYAMELEYAPVVRSGDPSRLRIIFQPLEAQARPEKLPVIENIYVETRLELPGLRITPAETAGQIFSPGRVVTFWWTIAPGSAGVYEGTVWLGLRVKSSNNEEGQFTALAAPRVKIKVSRLLFLSGPAARWMGAFGVVFSVVIFFWRWRHA